MSSQPDPPPVLYRRSTILFLIFFVAGGLTIPILWRSPAFSRTEKIFWSVVAGSYTTLMFVVLIAYVIVMFKAVGRLNVDVY